MGIERVSHPQRVYIERMGHILRPGMVWLDIGCGRSLVPKWFPDQREIEGRLKSLSTLVFGVDLDLNALRVNRSLKHRLLADASILPFAAESFDLVTSNMVFEHVRRPYAALAEIRRVMRPGGRLIIHTPNILDIVAIAARVIPNCLHPRLVSWIEGRAEEDVYPTHYSFNRRRVIEQILRAVGFRQFCVEYLDHPNVYGHVPVVARIEALWHRLAQHVPRLRGTLLVEAEV
jgi:ubiquinone/menaquinone biosynthesis C-methylase UbiE